MKRKYNWGILGTGQIAHTFAEGLKLLDNAVLYSVGSRSTEKAKDFSGQHGFRKYYGDYSSFASDPDLDVVYIASPHSHHKEHTLLCLGEGKNVLCEKAFALNYAEVSEMIDMSRKKGLFLMEALWPPFQDYWNLGKDIINRLVLGEPVLLSSRFTFKAPDDPDGRLYNLGLGGGALLDIGIYPVIDALYFLGKPDGIVASANICPTGADTSVNIMFDYNSGATASLFGSIITDAGIHTEIACGDGTLFLERVRDGSQKVIVTTEGRVKEEHSFTPKAHGFHNEAAEVMRCLDRGAKESEIVPLSFSELLISTLDNIRSMTGIVYPGRD